MSATSEMAATVSRIVSRYRRSPDMRELLARLRDRFAGTPERKAVLVKRSKIFGPPALLAAGLAAYFALRPMPRPDYRTGNLRKVFTYTLLTDQFNNLPIEERLKLIGQLVQRMKSMSAGDSALLAAFAAGIAGQAREQIERNASRLAIDLWDKYAGDYAGKYDSLSPADRAAYLDATFLEFMHTMEALGGETGRKNDSELLADARKQAKRDMEAMGSGKFKPPPHALGRFFTVMRNNVGEHATPTQRARGQLLMRDMVRHFRGEDGGK
jgi:hypothetical protein